MPKIKYIIGIDEVGRGPLAGPVIVCALALPAPFLKGACLPVGKGKGDFSISTPLRDSKKLSPKQREIWFQWVKQQKIFYAVSSISPKTIDKINISQAANRAATKAFLKLLTNNPKLTTNNCKIFLDGGLKLRDISRKYSRLYTSTIIKGDELIPAISLASIVAKIHRDKYMQKMHKKYPEYEFHKHKGYGTKLHYKNLKKNGHSKIHRKSFLKPQNLLWGGEIKQPLYKREGYLCKSSKAFLLIVNVLNK